MAKAVEAVDVRVNGDSIVPDSASWGLTTCLHFCQEQ